MGAADAARSNSERMADSLARGIREIKFPEVSKFRTHGGHVFWLAANAAWAS
jgi:hypothetical protein